MPIRKIEAGRVVTKTINTFVGQEGTIFYDEGTGEFRLSDGVTPGGIPLGSGGGTAINLTTVSTSILPATSGLYSIGTPTSRWSTLYLSSSSLYLGTDTISVIGGQLYVNGSVVSGTVGTSTVTTISSGTGVTIIQSGTDFNISIGQDVSTTTSVTFSSVNFISTITTSTMLITDTGITFPNGSFQDRKAPRMYLNADAALGIGPEDLFPGDYYYDDATASIYITVPVTDSVTGDFLYIFLLDITVRAV